MRKRNALAAAAVAALLGACGKDTCPTTAANAESQDMNGTCGAAPQQVSIRLNLCEACSHTAPTCTPDLHAAGPGGANSGDIFLDTKWEICTDNSSCSARACSFVTCQFSVPGGTYRVTVLGSTGTPVSFGLDTTTPTPQCSGAI